MKCVPVHHGIPAVLHRDVHGGSMKYKPFVGKQQNFNVSLIRYEYFLSLMRHRPSFTFIISVCVCVCACVRACARACVRACVRSIVLISALFLLYFFIRVYILYYNLSIISHALCLAGSASIKTAVGARRKLNHHWLMIFLYRDLLKLVCIPALLTKHVRRTSPSHQ